MNGQEYLQAVRSQFENDGWQVQSKQLDTDVVMLQGHQGDRTMLCMVINGEASGAHVQRLVELADDAGAGAAAIAAKNGHDTAADTVIDQHGINTIDVDAGGSSGGGGDSTEGVSRRTAVLTIAGAGVLGAGGFYAASTMDGLPSLGGGGSIGELPISSVRPNPQDLSVSGSVTPSPPEEGATEVDVQVTATSSGDEDRELELVAVTFIDNEQTNLAAIEIRESQTISPGQSVTFSGTYSVDPPPDWRQTTSVIVTVSLN